MKKNQFCIYVIGIVLLLCLGGCKKDGWTENSSKIDQDLTAFSTYIFQNIKFADELSQIEEEMIETIYELPKNVKGIVYVGSGATSEEFAIFQAPDSTCAEETLEAAKVHINDQIESFASYLPEEVDKLKHAFIKKIGNDVIVIVSEGKDVETIVKEYLK